ncbi:alkaline phosphatase family protein [Glycomyces paridis]|uniref:Alkaline phosphatase family protein n=1 Tax=Glycomyces paridis TaxID=2126555 RepID=A0A4S8PGD1_9ACTN|nr:alkaline phosphatase family protein [Glycomyces paridis]THV28422.1 alkaline phosphatase family protein [Glycomyces paridis]
MPSSPHLAPLRPAYGTGTLADVMPTALAALGVPGPAGAALLREGELDGVRRVAVLLLDGFGYHLLGQAAQASATIGALHHGELGTLTPITATVPSSTPISLASLSCDVPPGLHGIIGFTLRVPTPATLSPTSAGRARPTPRPGSPNPPCSNAPPPRASPAPSSPTASSAPPA